jgi:hypothetical protein
MSRRYTFPEVREIVRPLIDARPPLRPPSQRELVAASLLLGPRPSPKR